MSGRASTSRERIIPIEMESEETEKGSGEPSTSKPRSKQVVSTQIEADTPSGESKEKKSSLVTSNPEKYADGSSSSISFEKVLPVFNVKEKIVLVLDSAEDENFTPFLVRNGQNKPLDMLKYALKVFMNHKELINKNHEYALAVLGANNVIWVVDFTNNVNIILHALEEIDSCQTEDIFSLDSLFDFISQKVEVPQLCAVEDLILPPPYVVRVVLLYGRSYTMPTLQENDKVRGLLTSPFFILDILMTHEPIDDNNNCNKIFGVLQNLDTKGYSYFLPVGRDCKALLGSVGKLLGHPLQRPKQSPTNFLIEIS